MQAFLIEAQGTLKRAAPVRKRLRVQVRSNKTLGTAAGRRGDCNHACYGEWRRPSFGNTARSDGGASDGFGFLKGKRGEAFGSELGPAGSAAVLREVEEVF